MRGAVAPNVFPSRAIPETAGWHIDGSYDVDGRYWVNVHSSYRALLVLFLFTDAAETDAPTELIVGSHLDVARVLAPYGERGPLRARRSGRRERRRILSP